MAWVLGEKEFYGSNLPKIALHTSYLLPFLHISSFHLLKSPKLSLVHLFASLNTPFSGTFLFLHLLSKIRKLCKVLSS